MYSKIEFIAHSVLSLFILFANHIFQRFAKRLPSQWLSIYKSALLTNKNLSNHIIIITGANTGIGKASAQELASLGGTVILACRDEKRGLTAEAEINQHLKSLSAKEYPYAAVGKARFMKLDLSDLHAVYDFTLQFKQEYSRIDILINNAGLNTEKLLTNDLEQLFQVNYLGHYLLFRYLADLLHNSNDNSSTDNNVPKVARVINLSSVMHHTGQHNFKRSALRQYTSSMKWNYSYYSDSKLYMNLLTLQLNRQNHQRVLENNKSRGIIAISVNPGAVSSDIWRNIPLQKVWKMITSKVFLNVSQGSVTTTFAATVKEEIIQEYQATYGHHIVTGGKLSMISDIPYIIPYSMPWNILAFEIMNSFAGPQFAAVSLPSTHSCKIKKNSHTSRDSSLSVSFTSPVDLSLQLWKFSAEISKRILLQSGVSLSELTLLDS